MLEEAIRIEKALNLLKITDLPEINDFGKLLKKKYYELAFELHPDKKGTKEDFQMMSEAYQLLTETYKNNKELLNQLLHEKQQGGILNNFNPGKTNAFTLYKKAVNEYTSALEDYFNKVRVVNLNPSDPDYIKLCEKIKDIKNDFFVLVKSYPTEAWVGDCIDKIHRINVWLKKTE
jgi:hypothetical protein